MSQATRFRTTPHYPTFPNGKIVVLEPIVEHDRRARTITFSLDKPLPVEAGRTNFIYNRNAVGEWATIKNPELALCESPRVRAFLNGLRDYRHLEIRSFGLRKVKVHYSLAVKYEDVLSLFHRAFRTAFSLRKDQAIRFVTR